jgi:hypothetical protein
VLRQRWSRGQVEARLANIPPCMKFVATKTADQLDLQALHRVEPGIGVLYDLLCDMVHPRSCRT